MYLLPYAGGKLNDWYIIIISFNVLYCFSPHIISLRNPYPCNRHFILYTWFSNQKDDFAIFIRPCAYTPIKTVIISISRQTVPRTSQTWIISYIHIIRIAFYALVIYYRRSDGNNVNDSITEFSWNEINKKKNKSSSYRTRRIRFYARTRDIKSDFFFFLLNWKII